LVRAYLGQGQPDAAFALSTCGDLKSALDGVVRESYALVLLDLGLPNSQGLKTLEAMHYAHPGLPVVVLTGSDDVELGVAAIGAGAIDFLAKERIDDQILPRVLRYAIEKAHAEDRLRASEEKYRQLFEGSLAGVYSSTLNGVILDCNDAFARLLGYASCCDMQGLSVERLYSDSEDRKRFVAGLLERGSVTNREGRLQGKDDRPIWVVESARLFQTKGPEEPATIDGTVIDITHRRLMANVLAILNRPNEWQALIEDILLAVQDALGMEAVAVRLKQGNSYPYALAEGFPEEFLAEADRQCPVFAVPGSVDTGNELSECTCARIVRGESSCGRSVLTAGGSFWCNSMSALASSDSADAALVLEGSPCHAFGYESVALIPIHSDDRIVGLLQLNDHRPGMLDLPLIHFFEDLTKSLGVALKRQRTEERIRKLLKRQTRINRLTLDLGLTLKLEETFQTIHEHVRELLDADAFIISLFDEPSRRISAAFVVTRGERRDASAFPPIPLEDEGQGTQSRVIRSGEPLVVSDWQEAMRRTSSHYRILDDGDVVAGSAQPDRPEESDVTRSAAFAPMKVEGHTVGVLQVQSRRLAAYDEEDLHLLAGLANVAANAIRSAQLVDVIEADAQRLRRTLDGTIQALSRAAETRDPYTAGHQRRVTELAVAIAGQMALDQEQIEQQGMAGLLHDIGKMSVPAEILLKPARLSEIEFSMLKNHPQTGFDILKSAEMPWNVAEIILQHHERLDGSGYPRGIMGDAILIESRLLAVADVVDAMSSHRPYRPALGIQAALEEITDKAGTLYDAAVVKACLRLFREGFAWTKPEMGTHSR